MDTMQRMADDPKFMQDSFDVVHAHIKFNKVWLEADRWNQEISEADVRKLWLARHGGLLAPYAARSRISSTCSRSSSSLRRIASCCSRSVSRRREIGVDYKDKSGKWGFRINSARSPFVAYQKGEKKFNDCKDAVYRDSGGNNIWVCRLGQPGCIVLHPGGHL
jgi:hypothetical protein